MLDLLISNNNHLYDYIIPTSIDILIYIGFWNRKKPKQPLHQNIGFGFGS